MERVHQTVEVKCKCWGGLSSIPVSTRAAGNRYFFPKILVIESCKLGCRSTWNPKQPFINGCFNWMIPNLYIGNGCFTKHPFLNGCLGFQVTIIWPSGTVSQFNLHFHQFPRLQPLKDFAIIIV